MAEVIRMPKMSDTMVEGVIANWLKKEGDVIKSGDIIAEVETDKATMELENYEDGTILYIGVKAGEAVPVDGIIAIVGTPGEDYSALLSGSSAPEVPTLTQEVKVEAIVETKSDVSSNAPSIDLSSIPAKAVRMPKMSDTMVEGVIAKWLKNVGDIVKSGDIIAEVETDKATMELENYEDGTILYIGAKEGEGVPVDGVIMVVGEPGTDYAPLLTTASSVVVAPASSAKVENTVKVEDKKEPVKAVSENKSIATTLTGELKASPLARAMAKEKGFNLNWIKGTGEGGRIVKSDIDNYNPNSGGGATGVFVSGEESFEDIPNSQMRKTIARRLSESKFSAPEFYLTMEINMDKAIEVRKTLVDTLPVKISFNDMVIKAVALSLTKHPKVNSYWMEDRIRVNKHVHIGMAVAVEDGLLVPVIRFANEKSIAQISTEAKDLGGKAKNKQLQPKDWEGNTFTVSNLGMFGIDQFTSIINSPESCILAVGGIKETVGVKNGQFFATNIMKLTLTCDHRVVDGAAGAAFLQTLKQYLEDPIRMFI